MTKNDSKRVKLLEEDMDTEVRLSIDDPHQDEHGDCEGYIFDIDSVSHEFGECMIKFTDWREKNKSNCCSECQEFSCDGCNYKERRR